MAIDFREEIWELGVQSPYVPHEWDNESKKWRDNRVDDVDLAHDMALAMDPLMERVVEQRKFLGQLTINPDATYRRAGKKAVIFSELIETQKAIEDEKGEHVSNYRVEPAVEDYLHKAVSSYIFEKEGRSTYYTAWVPKKEARITNGFVAKFAEKQLNRTEQAADKAGAIVYFKQKERENIAVFEANLSKRDQEVFQRIKPRDEARDSSSHKWLDGDEEALSLSSRVSELWDIYTRKRIVEMVAKTFGRGTTRGFTRQDFEQLADVVDDSYYTLTH